MELYCYNYIPQGRKKSFRMKIVQLIKHYRPQYIYKYGYTNAFHFANVVATYFINCKRPPVERDILDHIDALYEKFRANDSKEVKFSGN